MPRESVRHAIRDRLLYGVAIAVVVAAASTAGVFLVAADAIARLEDRVEQLDRIEDVQHDLETALFTQEAFVFDYALSRRDFSREEFDAASEDALIAYADLRALAAGSPKLLAAVELVNATAGEWRHDWAEPFIHAVELGSVPEGATAVEDSEVLFVPAEAALVTLDDAVNVLRLASAAEAEQTVQRMAAVIVPLGLVTVGLLAGLGMWLTRAISGPLLRLSQTAKALAAGEPVSFTAEHDDEVGALAEVLEQLRQDVDVRYETARQEGEHAAVFNQLAELTSFATDEHGLVEAAGYAIQRLVPSQRGDILLANASQNRLTAALSWGDDPREPGVLVNLDRIDQCPGIRRSAAFVSEDLGDDMAVRCPAHPASAGTVACVPMSALGKIVGVMHLEHTDAGTFTPDRMRLVARVAESVGLAMANARMMTTMEGQAMSDPLTGLRNSRFFDPYLEQELEQAQRDRQPTSVIMIDLDHFKAFNDSYGHPAGDDALRAFSRVLGRSIRSADVAARYGGEEFVVALHHAALDDARDVAEKIRAAVEQTVVEIGPGRYGRITASFGVSSTENHLHDLRALVAMADAALYRAKEAGRNRVEVAALAEDVTLLTAAARRRRGTKAEAGDAVDEAAGDAADATA